MGERETTARAREVGNMLRSIRDATNLTVSEVADRLGWSVSKVSRVERGVAGIDPAELVRYAAHCGAVLGDIDFLIDRCQEAVPPGYWMSKRLASLIFHESTAAFSSSYDSLVVPGLLQTEEYATALFSREGLEHNLAEARVRVRMVRQHGLHSRGFEFFVHEQALRLPVGGNPVMNEQMLKLVLLADQPQITIRVVPTAAGQYGMFGPPFVLFRYTGGGPLVYMDAIPAGLFVEERGYVAGYHSLLAEMSDVALGRGESREVLAGLASAFDQPEDAPDDSDHLAEEQLQRGI
jgi:transcriptional regulator with XRE-family HTH domain